METSVLTAPTMPLKRSRRVPKFTLLAVFMIVILAVFSVHDTEANLGAKSAKPVEEPAPVSKMPTLKKIGYISLGALATLKIASHILSSKASSVSSLPGQTFVGSGIRAKGPISVYSVKMFVGNRAKGALSAFKGKELKGDSKFVDTLSKSGFQKTIQIEMLRTVTPTKMINSFNDAMSARIPKSTFSKLEGSLGDLLTKSFTPKASSKGSQITFSMTGGTSFSISVEGENQGSIWSPVLCQAFTDLYVGPKAVSSGARDNIISGLQEYINS